MPNLLRPNAPNPILLILALIVLSGCASTTADSALSIKILHINDHHSHLLPDNADLILDGKTTRVKLGGFPQVVSKFNQLDDGSLPLLKLHAGDAITGDLFYTLFKGEADAALMNEICFDVFALGNHEFDDGDQGLAQFLDWLKEGDCRTEVVAANVVPELGVSPLTRRSMQEYFTPYTVISLGGQNIGIIGIDIAIKTKRSSNPDATTQFLDEVSTAQRYIDELSAKGINKIILLTHYQYANDLNMAAQLRGVDVIVGGDSHTLLGDFAGVGLNPAGPYPTLATSADGQPVCIVQAWQYSAVVGELQVSWDKEGHLRECRGTPHLLLGDTFLRRNAGGEREPVPADVRASIQAEIEAHPELSVVEPDQQALAVLEQFRVKVAELSNQVVGSAAENLCFERIPGQGLSKLCDRSATMAHGSDISSLVAHAFRAMSNTSDIGIQNGGGVRSDLAAGPISIGDAYTLLPFANTLVELTMTGSEIKQVLEDATAYALQPGGSDGAYPYAAGLRWHVDLSKTKGDRFSQLQVKTRSDRDWQPLDPSRRYTVVTNSYIASGKDGYATFGDISKQGRVVDTFLDYAQSFVDYVRTQRELHRLSVEDYSTQKIYDRNGQLLETP